MGTNWESKEKFNIDPVDAHLPAWAETRTASGVGLALGWLGIGLKAAGDITEIDSALVGFHSGFNGEKVGIGRVHLLWHPRAVLDSADGETSAGSTSAGSEFCVRLAAKRASIPNPRDCPVVHLQPPSPYGIASSQ